MDNNVIKLYNNLIEDGYSDLGTYEDFKSKLQDESSRRKMYDNLNKDGYSDLGDYNSFNSQLGFASSSQASKKQEPITRFDESFIQHSKGAWQAGKIMAANTANVVTGSQRDAVAALQMLDELEQKWGMDSKNIPEEGWGKYIIHRKSNEDYNKYVQQWHEWANRHPSKLDKAIRTLPFVNDPIPKNPKKLNAYDVINLPGTLAGIYTEGAPYRLLEEAFQTDNPRAYLDEKANQQSWGDKVEADALREMATFRDTKGFAAWAGGLAPMMIPTAISLAASSNPYTKPLAKPIGMVGLGAIGISSGGGAIAEARQYAAEKGIDIPESDVLNAGITSSMVTTIAATLPYGQLTKGLLGKYATGKIVEEFATNPTAANEAKLFFSKAYKDIPYTSLFSKQGMKEFGKHVASGAVAGGAIETSSSLVPMLYKDLEDYPELKAVVNRGLEGAVAGAFMSGIMSGPSSLVHRYVHNSRRIKQGTVTLAETREHGIVEVIGEEKGYVSVLKKNGETINIPKSEIGDVHTVPWKEFKDFASSYLDKNVQKAFEHLQAGEKKIIKSNFIDASQVLDNALEGSGFIFDKEKILTLPKEEQTKILNEVLRAKNLTEEQKKAIINYVMRGNAYYAMNQAFETNMANNAERAVDVIKSNVNPDMDGIVMAKINGDEKLVTNGNIVRNEDGSINREASDKQIFHDDKDGNKQVESINSVDEMTTYIPQGEATNQAVDMVTNQSVAQQENEEDVYVGQSVTFDAGGRLVTIEVNSLNPDGSYNVDITDKQTGEALPINIMEQELKQIFEQAKPDDNPKQSYADVENEQSNEIAKQKDDIERRRQEEIEEIGSQITVKETVYEIITEGEPLIILVREKMDGSKQSLIKSERYAEIGMGNHWAPIGSFNKEQPLERVVTARSMDSDELIKVNTFCNFIVDDGTTVKQISTSDYDYKTRHPAYRRINAKYDAELAALESQQKQPAPSVEEITARSPKQQNGKVDYNALMEQSPEDYATLMEQRNGVEETKAEFINDSNNLQAEIDNRKEKLSKETDRNKKEDLRDEISELNKRKQAVDGIIQSRYTPKEESMDGATSFETVIDRIFSGNRDGLQQQFFEVAPTPEFMKKLGITGDRFMLSYGVISRHIKKDKNHRLTPEIWKQLPQAIQTPFAITSYKDGKTDGYRLYTTIQVDNGFVVVGVDVKKVGRDIDVNSISTVFNKEGAITGKEQIIYESETITPQQKSVLKSPNRLSYSFDEELSADKGTTGGPQLQETNEKSTNNSENSNIINEIVDVLKNSFPNNFTIDENNGRIEIKGTDNDGYSIRVKEDKEGDYQVMLSERIMGMDNIPALVSFFNKSLTLDRLNDIPDIVASEKSKSIDNVPQEQIQRDALAQTEISEQIRQAESEVDINPSEAQKEADNFLSESEYLENGINNYLSENGITREQFDSSDISVDVENNILDSYSSYIQGYKDSGMLQSMYDNASIGEEIKIRKGIEAAGYDVNDIIDTSAKKAKKREEAKIHRESKRAKFDPTNFQIIGEKGAAELEAVNARFNEELQQQIDGTLPEGHVYNLGMPGTILTATGFPNLPIELNADILLRKATIYGHDFDLSEIIDLPQAIQNPIAVFSYGDKSKAQNIIIETESKDGKKFLVGVSLNPNIRGKNIEINSIRNVFPKDTHEWVHWINQGKGLYYDKEKVLSFLDQRRINPADVAFGFPENQVQQENSKLSESDWDSATKIIQDFENPKLPEEKSQESPNAFTPISEQEHNALLEALGKYGIEEEVIIDSKRMREDLEKALQNNMQSVSKMKEKQLSIVIKYNPAPNDINTWIRTTHDILTAKEAFNVTLSHEFDNSMYPDFTEDDMRAALDSGEITIYSSKPIHEGTFVTPSLMNAKDYAGGGKVYSKTVKLTDIAWIDESEGQYTPIQFMSTPKGEVYGFIIGKKVYLDPNKLNANTPIHEFGHLYWPIMPAEMRAAITSLLKQTARWKELENNPAYADLKTDDQKANEIFNTILGNYGENSQRVQEIIGKDITLMARIKNAIREFWEWLKAKFGNTEAKINQFAKQTLNELLSGKNLENKVQSDNFVENNSKNESRNETRLDNRTPMERSTESGLVGKQPEAQGIYRTIEAANTAGIDNTIRDAEELEELEGLKVIDAIPSINQVENKTEDSNIDNQSIVSEPAISTQLNWSHSTDVVSNMPEGEGLPTQTDGSITFVERVLSEQKGITFMGESLTGATKIESSQDIAFLFKNLESAASENVFCVLHKADGAYSVLYLSTGTSNMSLVDIKQIVAAANEMGAVSVSLVHNHPSGVLIPSRQDFTLHNALDETFLVTGINVNSSIIINLNSGKYAEFDSNDVQEFIKMEQKGEIAEAKVYQFDRLKLYENHKERYSLNSPGQIAEFLSVHKRGTADKTHLLVLDSKNKVNRYVLLDSNLNIRDFINTIITEVGKHGDNVVIASNNEIKPHVTEIIQSKLKKAGIKLIDELTIRQNNEVIQSYVSAAEEGLLMDTEAEYNQVNEETNSAANADESPQYKQGEDIFDYIKRLNTYWSEQAKDMSPITKEIRRNKNEIKRLREKRDRLKEKIKKVREKTGAIRENAKAVKQYIQDNMAGEMLKWMGEREFNSLMSSIENATKRKDLYKVYKAIDRTINEIETRKNSKTLETLLKTKVIGKNNKGVSVAKNVDEETRQSMEYINANRNLSKEEIKKRIDEIQERIDEGKVLPSDGRMLSDLAIVDLLSDVNIAKNNIRQVDDEISLLNKEALHDLGLDKKGLKLSKDNLQEERILAQYELNNAYGKAIDELNELISTGKSKLMEWKQKEIEHKREIGRMVIEAVKKRPVLGQGEEKEISKWERFRRIMNDNPVMNLLLSPLDSFNFMLKYIDVNHPIGKGKLYQWAIKSNEGIFQAHENSFYGLRDAREKVFKKGEEIFGKDFNKVVKDSRKYSGMRLEYWEGVDKEGNPVTKSSKMTNGELLYLYMVSKMEDGKVKLENMGIDDASIETIREHLGDKYIQFSDWIQGEFLPKLREKYNGTHKKLYGVSMAEIENYFPLTYFEKDLRREIDLNDSGYHLPSTITGNIINRVRNKRAIDIGANAIDVLMNHLYNMEKWNAYAPVRKEWNGILSNKYIRNLIEANDHTAHKRLKKSAEIATESYNENIADPEKMMAKVNRYIAGGKIAFRLGTAIKQILSYPAFLDYSINPVYWSHMAKNATPFFWVQNFRWAMDNLPGFRERWETGNMGDEKLLTSIWEDSKHERSALGKTLDKYAQWGFFPNKLIDAMTVVAGSKSVYDFAKMKYSQRMSVEEAHRMALFDAGVAYNESQQSSRPEFLSPVQASQAFWSRAVTTFQNSNLSYGRKMSEAIVELARTPDAQRQIGVLAKEYEQDGMNGEEARSKAFWDVFWAKGEAVNRLIIYGWLLNLIWYNWHKHRDDDDEKKKDLINDAVASPLNNLYGGQIMEAAIKEGDIRDPLLFFQDMGSSLKKRAKALEDEGLLSPAVGMETSKMILNTGGVDIDTWINMYTGIEAAVKRGKQGDWPTMTDWHYFENAPKSYRKAYAKDVQDGESLMDYIDRVGYAYNNEKQLTRDMNKLLDKYLYSKDNDMTEFNRTMEKANEWKAMYDEINKYKKEENDKAAEAIESSPRYKELDREKDFYESFLKVVDVYKKFLKDDLKDVNRDEKMINKDVDEARKEMKEAKKKSK